MAHLPLASRMILAVLLSACFGLCGRAAAQSNDGAKPPPAENPEEQATRIDRLIRQLGDPRFTVRERAQSELADIGGAAFDALTAAQSNRDLEIAQRARTLVQSIRMEWIRESDSADVRKLLSDYDTQPDLERRKRIAQLALKPQAEGLAPLCRVVRFERSVLLSKLAAVTIMDQKRPTPSDWSQRSRIILEETQLSKRPTVRWLRAYAVFPTQPDEALADWKSLVAEEEQGIKPEATHEQRSVLAGLLRQQVVMLWEQTRGDQAREAMRRMLDLENGDSEPLVQLIAWLIEQKAWPLMEEVAQRLDRQFGTSPLLIYFVAQSFELQGDSKRAGELAAKALAHQAGANADYHFNVGYRLQQHGLMKWAEGEYRAAIESDTQGTFDELAYGMLGELLADQQRYKEAADVLDGLVQKMNNPRRGRRARSAFERSSAQVQARMNYFRGRQFAQENQTDKQLQHLEEALKHDPTEADVLIALYRIENLPMDKRTEVLKKIKRAVTLFEQRLTAAPDDTTHMNQYAWLVGNTEGDTEKAIRLSQRSIELARPEQLGGYLDTLAHCYASKKDYETALKHQGRAAELEPHSGEIRRAYERFKKLHDAQSAKDNKQAAPNS